MHAESPQAICQQAASHSRDTFYELVLSSSRKLLVIDRVTDVEIKFCLES
jgi:hypothetical protein